MIVDGKVALVDVIKALAAIGATVVWDKALPLGDLTQLKLDCDVHESWLISEDPDHDDRADECDVEAFVAAAAMHDRGLALALAGRIFVTDRCQAACEKALRQ